MNRNLTENICCLVAISNRTANWTGEKSDGTYQEVCKAFISIDMRWNSALFAAKTVKKRSYSVTCWLVLKTGDIPLGLTGIRRMIWRKRPGDLVRKLAR